MADYSDFYRTVREFMDEYSSDATYITQMDVGEYNPATATSTANIGEFPVRCILLDLNLQSNGARAKYRTTILEGDKLAYVEPTDEMLPILFPAGVLEIDPTDDRIVIGGVRYKVVTAKALDPAATGSYTILFELYLRR